LINRKNLADTWTTRPIDKAFSLLCQCGTGKEQIAAVSTLSAIALTDKKLGLNILFSEIDQPETPDLAGNVK